MDERALLRQLINAPARVRLTLPLALETQYLAYHRRVAETHLRNDWPTVAITLAVIAVLLLGSRLVTPDMRSLVMFGFAQMYALGSLVVMAVWVDALRERLELIILFVAVTALLSMHIATVLALPGNPLHSVAQFGVILLTVAVFALSNLTLRRAAVAVAIATFAFVLLVLAGGLRIAWDAFAIYSLGSALVGATIGFSQEIRERTVFLQGRLLLLEKREIDTLANELANLSRIDALTGLPNRRCFDEALIQEWAIAQREREPLGLLFIDVDHFKAFNDLYGHPAGDACLAQVAAALARQCSRASDRVARYGGEEFVGLFPRTGEEGLATIAARMIEAVDALGIAHAGSSAAAHVTVSIGAALRIPAADAMPAALLKDADDALYRAKAAGRHQWVSAWQRSASL